MTRAIAAMEAAMNMDQVIRINDSLAEVNTARIVAQRATERARAKLARVSTEALMAGMTLRQVANKTGYSISSVRRAKLLKPPSNPAGTRQRPATASNSTGTANAGCWSSAPPAATPTTLPHDRPPKDSPPKRPAGPPPDSRHPTTANSDHINNNCPMSPRATAPEQPDRRGGTRDQPP